MVLSLKDFAIDANETAASLKQLRQSLSMLMCLSVQGLRVVHGHGCVISVDSASYVQNSKACGDTGLPPRPTPPLSIWERIPAEDTWSKKSLVTL